jgi:hypothetical protein
MSASITTRQDETLLIEASRPVRLQDFLDTTANLRNDFDTNPLQDGFKTLRDGPADYLFDAPVPQLSRAPDQVGAGQRNLDLATIDFLIVQHLDHQEMPSFVAHGRYTGLPMRDCDLHASSVLHLLRQNEIRRDCLRKSPQSGGFPREGLIRRGRRMVICKTQRPRTAWHFALPRPSRVRDSIMRPGRGRK